MNYKPIEQTISSLPSHARENIRDVIDEMHKEGLLEYHKGKNCISINPRALDRVIDICRDDVPS